MVVVMSGNTSRDDDNGGQYGSVMRQL
jgi:hypothetical protein